MFDRLITTSTITTGGTTSNGTGVTNGGMAPAWIIDATNSTFVGYNTMGTGTGFQSLLSTGTPVVGTIEYGTRMAGNGHRAQPAAAFRDCGCGRRHSDPRCGR